MNTPDHRAFRRTMKAAFLRRWHLAFERRARASIAALERRETRDLAAAQKGDRS